MSYSRDVFIRAKDELKRRHERAENESQVRQQAIKRDCPEISAIQTKLLNTNIELTMAIIKGQGSNSEYFNRIKNENLSAQQRIRTMLKNFGYSEDFLDTNYVCKKCNDTGYSEGVMCSCFEHLLDQYSAEELNQHSTIKLRDFSEFNLGVYPDELVNGICARAKMEQNLKYCKNYCNEFGSNSNSLFFIGKTGLGKTFLSACMAKEILQNGYGVVFGSIMNYLRMAEDEHFGKATGNTIETLSNCDLCILDDLGSEFQSKFNEATLYEILNNRINLCKPTIISTNLSTAELDKRYNERIVSRLTGCFDILVFLGKDVRHLR